jgi:DNA-binding MarR family transcriptional regulator
MLLKEFLVQQIFATIFSLNNKILRLGAAVSPDMTLRQFMFILAIEHIPAEQCTYNRIAGKLETSKQNVKQIADSLSKKDMIRVGQSALDKRSVTIQLTDKGLTTALNYAKKSQSLIAMATEKMSGEELTQLWELLKRLYIFDGKARDGFDDNHEFTNTEEP